MIFQKKIIIGSIFSMIATAVGLIAVFFPDLLNLQKEKIETLYLDIATRDDAERFSAFIDKQESKIFKLDLMFCTEHDKSIQLALAA